MTFVLVQSFSQPSFALVFPSSHSSTLAWIKPSPHAAFLHCVVQAPVCEFCAPRSHSSPEATLPSPQAVIGFGSFTQASEQPSPFATLPSSHSSSGSTIPSPQACVPSVELQ